MGSNNKSVGGGGENGSEAAKYANYKAVAVSQGHPTNGHLKMHRKGNSADP